MRDQGNLQKVMMSIGLFLIGISLYCSFLLYTSFSSSLSDKAAWGGMGLGLDMFKNVALIAALALWALGLFAARILSVVVFIAYGVLTTLSFMAFFGFMSSVQHTLEKGAVLASNKYLSAKAAVEHAEQNLADLSRYANANAATTAENQLRALQPRLDEIRQGMARYANPDCSPKRDRRGAPYTTLAAEWCQRLRNVQAEAIPLQQRIDGYAEYQAALAHREQMLDELAKLDAGTVETGASHLHPMFIDLGKLLAAAPDEMKVGFMFISSASAEILGTLSVLIAYLLGRKRSFTLDEIEVLTGQLREQQGRLQHALSVTGALPAAHLAAPAGGPPGIPPPADGPDTVKSSPMTETPAARDNAAVMGHAAHGTRTAGRAEKRRPREQRERRERREPIRVTPEPIETPWFERDHVRKVLPEMSEAVLVGDCPPDVATLCRRYHVNIEVAKACLDTLVEEDYLVYDPVTAQYALNLKRLKDERGSETPICNGIAYAGSGRSVRIYFRTDGATLPVRRKTGQLAWMPWGRRRHETHSVLPAGGCVALNAIESGEWSDYNPRPVVIPASSYMARDNQGGEHWFGLDNAVMIQGLLAEAGEERRLYVVTVETPPEFAPISDSLPRPEGWPRLIRKDEGGGKPVFH